ncbi:MAG: hypothetical protein C4576_02395 [Desulfobacteraceae bacterium]|nr:MAG: hypothetical protein C4576_02395 [Desulfobacteraceae bacterium]
MSEGKQIGSILNELIRAERFTRQKRQPVVRRGPVLTTLGVSLIEQGDGRFLIDMSAVQVFAGIPGFVGYLGKQILENCRKSTTDVLTQVVVDADSTPELAALGLGRVVVYARGAVARYLAEAQQHFLWRLRLVFDALQTPQWGKLVFPNGFGDPGAAMEEDPGEQRPALHFPFQDETGRPNKYFFFVEYDCKGRFLRITVEDSAESRLFLKRIPHRTVKDALRFHYQQDIPAMAGKIFTGIHRECQNQRNEYTEIPGRQPALFELLISAGLTDLSGAVFRWTRESAESILLQDHAGFSRILCKILLLLEDESVIGTLSNENVVEMVDESTRIYLDLSRKGAMLNISIGEPRKQPDMMGHLKRMPHLEQRVEEKRLPLLDDYRVLLIHHATSEVLGFVKALQQARCPAVSTLFIRYRGIVPESLIEDMLSMPGQSYSFYGLQRVELRDAIGGAYILSRQYSPITGLERLDAALRSRRGGYLDSMRFAALHLFFREAFQAAAQGRKLLPIEDGGYIAPVLNRFCHEGKTLEEALAFCEMGPPPEAPKTVLFREWLAGIVPATFEHTANGYYQLQDVQEECGALQIPAFTIALSRYKNVNEAESCAYSILNAVESIFHGLGKCIMHRQTLVLGSRGNIGHFLFRAVSERVSHGGAYGIDLKMNAGPKTFAEFSRIEEVPGTAWRSFDLFLGMTGVSVLKREFFEKLLLQGSAQEIFFASGSTKTSEFADLTNWLGDLVRSESPMVGDQAVSLETTPIQDPQNGMLQGHRVRITFVNHDGMSPPRHEHSHKDIYLLGDSMPINFLYYGVPAEVVDGVFEELFCLVCSATEVLKHAGDYPPDIYAVDVNIDKYGVRRRP